MKYILVLFLTSSLYAEDAIPKTTTSSVVYKISFATLAGATAADFATSVGKRELNPVLAGRNGQFSIGKGIALKSVGLGTSFVLGKTLFRKRPKLAAIVNFAASGAFTYVAYRNLQNSRIQSLTIR